LTNQATPRAIGLWAPRTAPRMDIPPRLGYRI
jgi:hypothetical protein